MGVRVRFSQVNVANSSQRTCHVRQKLVLISEHRARSDNCRCRESLPYKLFALSLCLVKFGRRRFGRVQMRNLNELGDTAFRSDFGNPSCANSVRCPDIEIPAWKASM